MRLPEGNRGNIQGDKTSEAEEFPLLSGMPDWLRRHHGLFSKLINCF